MAKVESSSPLEGEWGTEDNIWAQAMVSNRKPDEIVQLRNW
jgi:hypothetical protein